jgi:hypothetical protein
MISKSKKELALREYVISQKPLAEVAKNHSMSTEALRAYAVEKKLNRKQGRVPNQVKSKTKSFPRMATKKSTIKTGLDFSALASIVKSHGIKVSISIDATGKGAKINMEI